MSETAVSTPEIIGISKREGFLAKQLYVIFTKPTNGIKPVMDNLKEHLAFQVELEKEGTMFAAGPNWTDDEKSWEGDGMVVVRAKSLAEAKQIAARDPMHKSGARILPCVMSANLVPSADLTCSRPSTTAHEQGP